VGFLDMADSLCMFKRLGANYISKVNIVATGEGDLAWRAIRK
jgi:hypothetical protein